MERDISCACSGSAGEGESTNIGLESTAVSHLRIVLTLRFSQHFHFQLQLKSKSLSLDSVRCGKSGFSRILESAICIISCNAELWVRYFEFPATCCNTDRFQVILPVLKFMPGELLHFPRKVWNLELVLFPPLIFHFLSLQLVTKCSIDQPSVYLSGHHTKLNPTPLTMPEGGKMAHTCTKMQMSGSQFTDRDQVWASWAAPVICVLIPA